jgi:hypothetical protein
LKQAADNDELLIRYLLGELSEEERERIEERYLSDPDFYEQLLTVEDDLIDAYVEDVLSQTRRASFEGHFLRSPGRQERVEFARAWMAYVARGSRDSRSVRPTTSVSRQPAFGFFRPGSWPVGLRLAVASLVVLACAGLVAETLRLRTQIQQSELQRAALEEKQRTLREQLDAEHGRSQELLSQLDAERTARDQALASAQPGSGLISLILTPGLVRGTGDAKRLVISPDIRQVRLQVRFARGEYESYGVVIRTVSGSEAWTKSGLKASPGGAGKVVIVQIPASLFKTEDYILSLSGQTGSAPAETINEYFFSVSKK